MTGPLPVWSPSNQLLHREFWRMQTLPGPRICLWVSLSNMLLLFASRTHCQTESRVLTHSSACSPCKSLQEILYCSLLGIEVIAVAIMKVPHLGSSCSRKLPGHRKFPQSCTGLVQVQIKQHQSLKTTNPPSCAPKLLLFCLWTS